MEILTLDASAPYKHLSFRVMPSSQYEKRVIVFRMRVCVDDQLGVYRFPWRFSCPFNCKQDLVGHCTPGASHCTPQDSGRLLLLSQYNMEVAPRVQEASSHAASLLSNLNLQRARAQFCDCVVRQKQDPGRLYPAHRCVLAASSPVLASMLSSTGALVELQAPCLSDSVLALLLDYVYTGALPHTDSQQQYCSLLTAACHLQMDELQEALRTWRQTEVNAADNPNASTGAGNQPYEDINNTYSKTVNTFSKFLPLSHIFSVNSLEREDHQYSANVDARDETQMHAASVDSCIKNVEIETSSSKNNANHCGRKDVRTLSNVNTCCSIPESTESSINTGNCRQITYRTPQDLIQNPHEVHGVRRVDKEGQKDQFHSAGTVKSETWHKSREEERVRTVEDRRSLHSLCTAEVREEKTSRAEKTQRLWLTVKGKAEGKQTNRKEEDKIHPSPLLRLSTSHLKDNVSPSQCSYSSSASSPQPCCGAVPVIRHSSRAAMLQLAEVSTVPPYHPVTQATDSSSKAPDSQSGSTDIVEGITTKCKNHYRAQNQDYTNNKDHIETQSWDYKDSSDQCATQDLCYRSNADQSDIIKQDYSSSSTDCDEHVGNGLSHITGQNDPHAHRDSFQNKNYTKHLRVSSVPRNKDCSTFTRGLKYKTDLRFDDFSSKHQRLDCSNCHGVSLAAEEQSAHSKDQRAVVSLSAQDSDTGSDSRCEDLCSEGEAKEEHSYSSRSPAEMDRQDSQSNFYGPKTDWYPNLHRAETSTKEAAAGQHEHDSDVKDTAMTDKRHSVDVCLSVSCTPESCLDNVSGGLFAFQRSTSLEHEHVSGTEITEPHLTFTMPVDNNMSDSTYSVVGQSYHGHLHYHCLPEEDTHFSHVDSDHKHSHPSHFDHSDQSSDEEEVGTFASPPRQHFATGTTDQVLLLDISAKPPELLVSYKHRSDEGETAVGHKDTSGNGFGQWNEATSAAGVDKRKIRARAKCRAETLEEAQSKSQVGETNVGERKSVGKEQSRPGAEVILCSPSGVPDSVQASVSSTLSVCIPSTLSASMPTNISAHLSTPVQHPFQCSLCDRSFSQRGSLNRHVRSHLGVRPFPCPRCPMTFSRQYRVTEHMRVHQRCVLGSDFQKPPT